MIYIYIYGLSLLFTFGTFVKGFTLAILDFFPSRTKANKSKQQINLGETREEPPLALISTEHTLKMSVSFFVLFCLFVCLFVCLF